MSRIDIYKGFEVKKTSNGLALIRFFDVVDINGIIHNKMNNLRCKFNDNYKKIIDDSIIETNRLLKEHGYNLI